MSLDMENISQVFGTTDRRAKIVVLEQLRTYCENSTTSTTDALAIFDECYLYLLKCYTDTFESIRDNAIQTVTTYIERIPPNDFHLVNIIAVLGDRMGQQETVEESEEIRLLLTQQLHIIIKHYIATSKGRSLQECYYNIVRVLAKAVRDKYPAVQREGCDCIVTVARAADTYDFQQWTEQLAKALYGMLNHKHSQSRAAAVRALAHLSLHIDAKEEALSRLIMEVSPLLMDNMPLVRRECGEMGVLMLLELRDRYSYFERIIPLVLCCLIDEVADVVDYIKPMWKKCGQQYYEENEEELRKQEIADIQVETYPIDVERPTIGCRALVQRSLRLIKLITRESSDWKENVRLHALKLLYQFVLHAEAAMTAKFFEIYPEVAQACRDAEIIVVKEAYKVSDLMGRLFAYEDWIEHGFDGLAKNAKEGYLKCFYYMFKAANGTKMHDLLRISKILIEPDFSQTLKPEFQNYVLKLVETVMDKYNNLLENSTIAESMQEMHLHEDTPELLKNLYIITIKVMALSYDAERTRAEDLQLRGKRILLLIAHQLNIKTDKLHELHFSAALAYVKDLDSQIDELSEPILLFYGLLSIAKFRATYLAQLKDNLNLVFKYGKNDAKVKIFSAISIAMLCWCDTISKDINESAELLQDFVQAVVAPHLEWRAGSRAEALRTLATATLCSIAQSAYEEAKIVLPKFVDYMPSLLEDNSTATRNYAIKCMFNFGALNIEQMRKVAYAVLQRLDDPSLNIRILAVTVIPCLTPKFEKQKGEDGEYEHSIWENFIKKTVDMLFLHYEGPEKRLQAAIKSTLIELTKQYRDICEESFKKTVATSYGVINLSELKSELFDSKNI